MKHLFILSLLICTFSNITFSQTFTLTGDLGIQGGELFTYRMELHATNKDSVAGFAYTYSIKNKEVKASIIGAVDKVNNSFSFEETGIIYNHGFESNQSICLIKSTLSYNNQQLTGKIASHTQILGAACASGTLTFSNNDEIKHLFESINNQRPITKTNTDTLSNNTTQPKVVKIIYDTASAPPPIINPSTPKPVEITDGKSLYYTWHSDTIRMQIWDGTQIDGDNVEVSYNGNVVLSNYRLQKERKMLTLIINDDEINIITIKALNEGGVPLNTAAVLLWDGKTSYGLTAYNSLGKTSVIRIQRVIIPVNDKR